MFDIIGKRFWFFSISAIVIIAGIVAMFVFGLKPGIEFKSGTEVTVTFDKATDKQQIVQVFGSLGYSGTEVRAAGPDYVIDIPADSLSDTAKADIVSGLTERIGSFKSGGFQTVSAKAASNLTQNTIIAIVLSALAMMLYISWAFRRMPNPFRWGVCAIASLVHDLLVAIGVFALLGGIFGWKVDLLFIAAVLTVIGYSVNDTIIIFDRIRENVRNYGDADFEGIVNASLVQTMSRTVNTSLTVLFTLVALWLIVGGPIQNLVIVMLVGIITGTYSSIGTAASLLVVWKNNEWGRFIGRKPVMVAAAKK